MAYTPKTEKGPKTRHEFPEHFEKLDKTRDAIKARLVREILSWGLKQYEAGDILGIHCAEVGKILRGTLDVSLDRLMILCANAGIPITVSIPE